MEYLNELNAGIDSALEWMRMPEIGEMPSEEIWTIRTDEIYNYCRNRIDNELGSTSCTLFPNIRKYQSFKQSASFLYPHINP